MVKEKKSTLEKIVRKVDIKGEPVLTITFDGLDYVSVTSIAHNMGLKEDKQRKLVKTDPILSFHYKYFSVSPKEIELGASANADEIKDEKLIGVNLGKRTQTHLFIEYEYLFGLLFITRLSSKKEIKQRQIEYKKEAFKLLHNHFKAKLEGNIPEYCGKVTRDSKDEIKHIAVIEEDSKKEESKLEEEKSVIFMKNKVSTLLKDNKIYIQPMEICRHLNLNEHCQREVIFNDEKLKLNTYKNKSRIWLDINFITSWLDIVYQNKGGKNGGKSLNKEAIDKVVAYQTNLAETVQKELGINKE
jgi:hypothetical protein